MKQGKIETFNHLSQFKDTKDFNNNFEQWMLDLKEKFTKSELVALKRLVRFSAKVAGVCNAKIGTVVSATHDKDGIGISRSTFKRMIVKAKEFGLVTVHETVRKNGSKSSNVYAFNRFCGQVEPSNKQQLTHAETINLFKTNNQVKDIRKEEQVVEKTKELDASFVSESVPADFVNLVKCYFNNGKEVEEYWKIVTISASKNKVTEGVLKIALQSFRLLVRKIKFCTVKNTYGFFFGILNKKFKAMYLKDLFNNWWDEETVQIKKELKISSL